MHALPVPAATAEAAATPRVRQTDRDVVYFLHIPRTGGSTLHEILAGHFPAERTLKGRSRRQFPRLLAELGPERAARLRFVSAHYDTNAADLLAGDGKRTTRFVTMLREPVARLKSLYEIIKRMPDHGMHEAVVSGRMTFLDWLCHPDGGVIEVDRQVRQVAGVMDCGPDDGRRGLEEEALLDLACRELSGFAFFGVHESYDESVRALHETFGWEAPAAIPHLNATPAGNDGHHLSADERELARQLTRLDERLHRFAGDLFRRRRCAARG